MTATLMDVNHGVYDLRFFQETRDRSLVAARRILPLIRDLCSFDSIVDIGCGLGTWLLAAQELGAAEIKGIDIPCVPRELLVVDGQHIETLNLEKPIRLSKTYDVCLCLELAEHLSPGRADALVNELVDLAPVVVFSAAIPFQGGDGHKNEIWPEFWAQKFAAKRFLAWTGLREEIWNWSDIPWWYRQNIVIYVKDAFWEKLLGKQIPCPPNRITAIHPECFIWAARRASARFNTSYGRDVTFYQECIDGTLRSLPGYGPEFQAPELFGRSKNGRESGG
jgi:SAM-dependent methyltransferase